MASKGPMVWLQMSSLGLYELSFAGKSSLSVGCLSVQIFQWVASGPDEQVVLLRAEMGHVEGDEPFLPRQRPVLSSTIGLNLLSSPSLKVASILPLNTHPPKVGLSLCAIQT